MCKHTVFSFCLAMSVLFFAGQALAQESLLHKFFMGNVDVWVLSLGWKEQKVSIQNPRTEAEKKATPVQHNSLNVLLLRSKGLTILVDTGLPNTTNELYAALLRAGVSPESITHVLLTHAHPDHTGGLLQQGRAAFPKAKLLMPKAELEYWLNPANKAKASPNTRPIFDNLPKILAEYKNKVFSFTPEMELFPELPQLRAMDAAGHTPGHVAFRLTEDGKTFLFWGDLVHAFDLQTAHPEISSSYDQDTVAAAKTRERILNQAKQGGWQISGSHVPFVQPRVLK